MALLSRALTETAWFRPVWKQTDAILFMAKRIAFDRPDGTSHVANSEALESCYSASPWRHLNTLETVCSECGWRKPAGLQTEETSKEFWCFHCGKVVIPRVISLRMTSAQRRLKGAFYIGTVVFIIVVLALALW
jgi:predicted RNA-binding Zn-ribbon protein involved in translation (DUF1610 family)